MNKITVCKTCGKEVATSAKTCPHCGAKLKKGKLKFIIGGIVGVLVLFILIGLFSSGSDNTANMNLVKNGHLGNYKGVTIGRMLKTNFSYVKWQAFESDKSKNIVEVDLKNSDKTRNIKIQFIINSDSTFDVGYMDIDGQAQLPESVKEILDSMYENYAESTGDALTIKVDADSSNTLKGTK